MDTNAIERLACTHERYDVEQAALVLSVARPIAAISYVSERQNSADTFVAETSLSGVHIRRMKTLIVTQNESRAELARKLDEEADDLGREEFDRRVGRLLGFPHDDIEWFATTTFPPDDGAWLRTEVRALQMLRSASISPIEYESLQILPYIPQPTEESITHAVSTAKRYARAISDSDCADAINTAADSRF